MGTQRGWDTHYRRIGAQCFAAVLMASAALMAKDRQEHVPFKLYRGYTIVTQGSIGNLGNLNLLIDTGAVPSVIDERIARKLHLAGKAETLSVFSKNFSAQRVTLPEVQVGPVHAESVPGLVQDLSFIREGIGVRVDAMIGLDVLGGRSFTIDYESKVLDFAPHEEFDSSASLESGPGYVAVQMLVNGRPVRLVVDTGAKDLILFVSQVRGRLPGARVGETKTSANLSGAVALRRVSLPATLLGNDELGEVSGFLLDAPAGTLPDFDGLLGVTSLGMRRINFDFEHMAIAWAR